MEMTTDDLFSCIGGHALGLSAAGPFRTIRFVESNSWRQQILSRHFPGVPIYDDIHTTRGITADILVGGPPCQQTVSLAAIHGHRTGASLWPEMRRLSQEGQYRWIIVEQPASASQEWFTQVAGDLAADGYHVARVSITAASLGAPHQRRRMFTVAHRDMPRLEIAWRSIASETERITRGTSSGNAWNESIPGTLRVDSGVSCRMDGSAKQRRERIEALGDSNPPVMMTVIGRAVLAAEIGRAMESTE